MISQTADHTMKYRVRRAVDSWRVDRAEDCLGVFATSAEAIEQACRSARADADQGRVAIVTTETLLQEFHCYVPPPGGQSAGPSGPATLPPYLRLLVSN
jgi:hypothetical protein